MCCELILTNVIHALIFNSDWNLFNSNSTANWIHEFCFLFFSTLQKNLTCMTLVHLHDPTIATHRCCFMFVPNIHQSAKLKWLLLVKHFHLFLVSELAVEIAAVTQPTQGHYGCIVFFYDCFPPFIRWKKHCGKAAVNKTMDGDGPLVKRKKTDVCLICPSACSQSFFFVFF